ncbi:esterase-like activity of phytase family protein [Tateyamaria sp. SN3-11]|uniref:esterase-like activity of phytase family protein n=1 Tax=Tateyamaria sp. SN3-11 TaxID=3092147 RepID=UPI0039EBD3E5
MRWRPGLALILAATGASADPLTHVRTIPLASGLAGFGGLSAIEMRGPDRAIVLSDRGQAFALVLDREAESVTITTAAQPQPHRDSEGLAYAGDQLFFSYEGPAEVVAQDGTTLPSHPDFATYHPNGSLEALAADADGTLYTLPERSGDVARAFPVYRFQNGQWDVPARLPRIGPFLPAGADIGPDGRLFVLERAFTPLGFRSRIRTLDPNNWEAPAQTLLKTRAGQHDNLEGLAIWQSGSGATCLSMVSDNNFLSVQRTEIVEYALTETLAPGKTCD